MKHTTAIDTIALQIDCDTPDEQRKTLRRLLEFISEQGFFIGHNDYSPCINGSILRREYCIYHNSRFIAAINTGSFTTGSHSYGYMAKYYTNVKFAGLKRHDEVVDRMSSDCLFMICAHLNTQGIVFKLTELDICIDAECAFEHILAVCIKKSPKTNYYRLNDRQAYSSTFYIEKIAKEKVDKAVLRAYTYDKSLKESSKDCKEKTKYDRSSAYAYNKSKKERFDVPITRFEIKLQPKYFNRHGLDINSIEAAFNRYCVMYFSDIEEKLAKIEAYNKYQTIRKREIKRLGFYGYRLFLDISYVEGFISLLYSVQNSAA